MKIDYILEPKSLLNKRQKIDIRKVIFLKHDPMKLETDHKLKSRKLKHIETLKTHFRRMQRSLKNHS